jgi:pyruvate ferredoxin oxidoreductase gamma subunit
VDLFTGCARGGFVLLNSNRTLAELGLAELARARSSTASHAARDRARAEARRAPGAQRGAAGRLRGGDGRDRLESVVAAIREKFPRAIADKNVAAARAAYELVARPVEVLNA